MSTIKTETKVGAFALATIALFISITIYLGIFRVSLGKYHEYTVRFSNASGLAKKNDIKIAGIKVGWIENIKLIGEGPKAYISIMVHKKYPLYQNAHTEIRQEGLLGAKHIELSPGDHTTGILSAGEILTTDGVQPASIDELINKFTDIAINIKEVTKMLRRNEGSFDVIINDLTTITHDIAPLGTKLNHLVDTLDSERIGRTLTSISSVAQKIDEGTGLIGKLINDDKIYEDVRCTSRSIRNYIDTINSITFDTDAHTEFMLQRTEGCNHRNAKGYLNLYLTAHTNHFCLFQIVGSRCGAMPIHAITLNPHHDENKKCTVPPTPQQVTLLRHSPFVFGLQFGKFFGDVALRCGLIEGYFGAGIDYFVPFKDTRFKWITSFEAFDLRGKHHLCEDHRPHLKWLNRLYMLNNIYMVFGADDFISKHNASAFCGFGISI